jgi:hypothetical protein
MRIAVIGQQNFHDVETKNDIGIVQQTQPGKTSFGNAQLLLSVYCLDRPTKIFVTSRFHFDETSVSPSRQTMSISPPPRARKLR